MTIFFTSDEHYFHRNIIKYCNRPYKTIEEMNEMLIANHNSVVKGKDVVYHLGDFGFADVTKLKPIKDRLNGTHTLIHGNHDNMQYARQIFDRVHSYSELKVPDKDASRGTQMIVLFHYSQRVWNKSHHGSWQLYGHSHGTLYDDPNLLSMDVGVDPSGYFPISYEQVKEKMKLKTFKPMDHHGKED